MKHIIKAKGNDLILSSELNVLKNLVLLFEDVSKRDNSSFLITKEFKSLNIKIKLKYRNGKKEIIINEKVEKSLSDLYGDILKVEKDLFERI